jgi:dTDP-4-dehydrorhamnose reductase
MKKTILVSGKNGQLGSELQDYAKLNDRFHYFFSDADELDITDPSALAAAFEQYQPAYFINCAAYTAVDKAETDRDTAFRINATATGEIARQCKLHNTVFLHVSTDYVFDGNNTTPYLETQATDPVNYYGYTKLAGEQAAFEHNPRSIVVRTSWVYSRYGANFVKTMLRLMGERAELNVVSDQVGSPTYAKDLADALMQMVEQLEAGKVNGEPFGIYHYSNGGIISWYDFATAIRDSRQLACKVNPIPTTAYPTPAKRPAYSAFDKQKIQQVFGITIRDWQESLAECLSKL